MRTRNDVARATPVTAVKPVAVCADVRDEKVNSAGALPRAADEEDVDDAPVAVEPTA